MDAPVLFACGGLQLGKALEAERLGEAHHGRAGSVGPAGKLLRGLKGRLVEMVHDVLRHVLLRTRALLEAALDVKRKALVLACARKGIHTLVGNDTIRRWLLWGSR